MLAPSCSAESRKHELKIVKCLGVVRPMAGVEAPLESLGVESEHRCATQVDFGHWGRGLKPMAIVSESLRNFGRGVSNLYGSGAPRLPTTISA